LPLIITRKFDTEMMHYLHCKLLINS
jgi:hypothetical protein